MNIYRYRFFISSNRYACTNFQLFMSFCGQFVGIWVFWMRSDQFFVNCLFFFVFWLRAWAIFSIQMPNKNRTIHLNVVGKSFLWNSRFNAHFIKLSNQIAMQTEQKEKRHNRIVCDPTSIMILLILLWCEAIQSDATCRF